MEANIDKIALRNQLVQAFSLEEMQVLCADLGIAFDDIGGSSRTAKALELIQYMQRRGRLQDLVNAIAQLRPSAVQSDVAQTSATPPIQESVSRVLRGSAYKQPVDDAELGPIKNRFALIVGIDRYVDPNFPKLKYCAKDAIAMADKLRELGYSVKLMHDGLSAEHLIPTRINVLAELGVLCEAASRDDMILVQFACHGEVVDNNAVLIMKDTRAKMMTESSLPVAEIERMLRTAAARRQVVLLDACHVGVQSNRRGLSDPEFIRNVNERALGFVLFAGSTSEQAAQEWDKEEHGVFTAYLLKGLSGAAKLPGQDFVTVDGLKGYVLNELRKWTFEHGGLRQDPTTRTEVLGDMILADFRKS